MSRKRKVNSSINIVPLRDNQIQEKRKKKKIELEKKLAEPFEIVVPKHMEKAKQERLKRFAKLHHNLPKPHFNIICIGPRNRGKSVLLYNLLSKQTGMYGTVFKKENIIFVSPTSKMDDTLKPLKLKHVVTIEAKDHQDGGKGRFQQVFLDVIDQQKKLKENNNMDHVLIVCDDITSIREAWDVLTEIGFRGRHYNFHVIAIAHKISSVPRDVRTSAQQWIVFYPHEETEIDWVLDTFSSRDTRKIWRRTIIPAWRENDMHNFLYIDFEEHDSDRVYRSGFHKPLFPGLDMHLIPELRQQELLENPELRSQTKQPDQNSTQ